MTRTYRLENRRARGPLEIGLVPSGQTLFEEALETLEVSTGVGDRPAGRQLTAETTTAEAVSRLLSEQRRVMEANLEGVCQDYDPEFLHDFRIAVLMAYSLCSSSEHEDVARSSAASLSRTGASWPARSCR